MIELKPKLYALEEAIGNGHVYPQAGAILTAYIKQLEGAGAVFKIEFGAD